MINNFTNGTLSQQTLSALASDSSPVLVNRCFRFLFANPVARSAVGL
jgi:hypothetical protein